MPRASARRDIDGSEWATLAMGRVVHDLLGWRVFQQADKEMADRECV